MKGSSILPRQTKDTEQTQAGDPGSSAEGQPCASEARDRLYRGSENDARLAPRVFCSRNHVMHSTDAKKNKPSDFDYNI